MRHHVGRLAVRVILGSVILAAIQGAVRSEQPQDSAPPTAAKREQESQFEGVSDKRSFEEALAKALEQMDKAVKEHGRYPCSTVNWRVIEIGGTSGSPAGLNVLRIKIAASFEVRPLIAVPDDELHGAWYFEHGALGEFDTLDLKADGHFLLQHRDVALGTTTTHGTWRQQAGQLVLRQERQEHAGEARRDNEGRIELVSIRRTADGLVLGKDREFRKRKANR